MKARIGDSAVQLPSRTAVDEKPTVQPRSSPEPLEQKAPATYTPKAPRADPLGDERAQYFDAVHTMRQRIVEAGGELAALGVDLRMAVDGRSAVLHTAPKLSREGAQTTASFGALINPAIEVELHATTSLASVGFGAMASGLKGYQVSLPVSAGTNAEQTQQAYDAAAQFQPPLSLTSAQRLPPGSTVRLFVNGKAMAQGNAGAGNYAADLSAGGFGAGSSLGALTIQPREDGKVSVRVNDQSKHTLGWFLSANLVWRDLNRQISDELKLGGEVPQEKVSELRKLTENLTFSFHTLHGSSSGSSVEKEYVFDPKVAAANNAYGALAADPSYPLDDAHLPAGVTLVDGYSETSQGEHDSLQFQAGPAGTIYDNSTTSNVVRGTTVDGRKYAKVDLSMVAENQFTKPWLGLTSGSLSFVSQENGPGQGTTDRLTMKHVVHRDDDTTASDVAGVASLAQALGATQTAASMKSAGPLSVRDRDGQNKREVRLSLEPTAFSRLAQLPDLQQRLQQASRSPHLQALGVTEDDLDTFHALVATLGKTSDVEARAMTIADASSDLSERFFALAAAVLGPDAVKVEDLRLHLSDDKYRTYEFTRD